MMPLPIIVRMEPRGLSRRQLILRSCFATGGLIVGGLLIRASTLFDQAAGLGRSCLSDREATILSSLVEATFPGGDMPPGDTVFMVAWLDDWLAKTAKDTRLLFKSMLHVIEDQSLLMSASRFSRRTLQARMREVRAWELTPIYLKRQAFAMVKFAMSLAYFEQPGSADAIGWYVGCAPDHLLHKARHRFGDT